MAVPLETERAACDLGAGWTGPAWSTIAIAGLITIASTLLFVLAWIAGKEATARFAYDGDPFWWWLDAIFSSAYGALLIVLAGVLVVIGGLLLRLSLHVLQRRAAARARSFLLLVVATLCSLLVFPALPNDSAWIALALCVLGLLLLVLPSTARDFDDRWGFDQILRSG